MEDLNREDAAQAIIVAGFLIAVGMVVVATLLNAMVFSQNLDARGVHVDSEGVEEFTQVTSDEADRLMERVQEKQNTPEEAADYYVRAMRNETEGIQHMPSADTTVARASNWENVSAWQFVQNEDTATLESTEGGANWTVATGIDDVFVLEFNKTKNYENGENFTRIRAPTGDGIWEIYVLANGTDPYGANDPSNDTVFVNDHGTMHEFEADGDWNYSDNDPVHIEVLGGENGNGVIENQDVNLRFPDDADEIEVVFGGKSEGTYEIRLDGNPAGNGPCPSGVSPDPECGIPHDDVYWTSGLVHRSNYTLTYVHPSLTHVDNVSKTYPREFQP